MPKKFYSLAATLIITFTALTATDLKAAFVCGDADSNELVTISDAVYLINYIFGGGSEPSSQLAADADGSGLLTISDVVFLINYIFGGGPEPRCLQYLAPPTTTIIPNDDTTTIQDFDSTSGAIALNELSTFAQETDIGDIVIGQDDASAPYGFLRKVTSKSIQSGSVILETEPATMMEAFEEMDIVETHPLLTSDVVSYKLFNGSEYLPGRDNKQFSVDLNVILYDQDGDPATTNDQIRLDGNYAFTADLFVEIEMDFFSLKKFEAGIETNEIANLDLTANFQWEFNEAAEFDLAEFHLGAIPVGGVVWLVPTLTVEAHIQGDLTVTFITGISYTQELRYGVGYADNSYYVISDGTKNFNYNPPQFTAEFNFEPGASINASCLLYGVAGPYMAGKAGFHFQSVLSADPCDVDLTFDLEAILYAVAGIECDILNLDYNEQWQLYTHLIGEWNYPLGGSGTIIVDPEPNSINAPWSLVGPCNYSSNGAGDQTLTSLDPGDYTVSWGAVSGWTPPSNSTQTLTAGETATFIGTYVEEIATGLIAINPSPDPIFAPWSLSGPNSFSMNGSGDDTLALDPGDYTITWGAVSGWITPASEMQTLPAGDTVTFNGVYVDDSDSTGTVTDYDGNVYPTIKIGGQWWMAENLKVTHYRNGDPIPYVTDNSTWAGLTTGAYCTYNDNKRIVAAYGGLYNWYAVADSRNIAPAGWHVPTDAEWQTLVDYLGGYSVAGGKMKEAGTTHWRSPNTGATNESGFSALPGGFRDYNNGLFGYMGDYAIFWSSTAHFSYSAWDFYLHYNDAQGLFFYNDRHYGFSVRCVRD